jgi:hypothetical protein
MRPFCFQLHCPFHLFYYFNYFLYVNHFLHWFYLLPCVHFLYYLKKKSFRLPLPYFQLLHTLIAKMDYNSFFAFTFHSH